MKKIWIGLGCIGLALFLTGCGKELSGSTRINDLLKEEPFLHVRLGEAYLQEEVTFDQKEDRAVVPEGAEWGLPKYREGDTAGASYGEEGGAEIYSTDVETNPELYVETYLGAIESLDLTVEEVRDSGYDVKVVKKKELEQFEEELFLLSGMVVKDSYVLTGVSIRFDDQCLPIKKEYHFKKKDMTSLENEREDRIRCTQKFSYDVGKLKFERRLKSVKKAIDRDM